MSKPEKIPEKIKVHSLTGRITMPLMLIVRRLLAPVFEPMFHDHSFGFIKQRNCHQAIEKVLKLHGEGYTVVLDADIAGFFDNLPHCVIMEKVRAEVADGNILDLVQRFLAAGVMDDGVFKPTSIGTPQGGVVAIAGEYCSECHGLATARSGIPFRAVCGRCAPGNVRAR